MFSDFLLNDLPLSEWPDAAVFTMAATGYPPAEAELERRTAKN